MMDIQRFLVHGIRCLAVVREETILAYVNLEKVEDVLFIPIDYHGKLPEAIANSIGVFDDSLWSGWAYPEELPIEVEEVKKHCALVVKATLEGEKTL